MKTYLSKLAITFYVLALCCHVRAQQQEGGVAFDLQRLSVAPRVFPANSIVGEQTIPEGIQGILYESIAYQGKPTKVFAWYGLPKKPEGESNTGKVPGVVLVHGGGGTAFANWVKLWNERGYAAIAMDLCGCVPVGSYGKWERHSEGGPPGWDECFNQIDGPTGDQWQTHAISAIALGNSLLSSYPEVDSDRIGVTGISWGGYLTCIVSGIDTRFKCAVPVYGCGYLGDNSVWLPAFEKLGKEKAEKWLHQWDPSVYLPRSKMPILWVNGTNDFAYPLDSWIRSTNLHSPRTLSLQIRMPHGHGPAGENPEEIHVFMNSILKRGTPFPVFQEYLGEGSQIMARFQGTVKIEKAELCFTKDNGVWTDRHWEAIPANLNSNTVSAKRPDGSTAWYFNLYDERGCTISMTPHTSEKLGPR